MGNERDVGSSLQPFNTRAAKNSKKIIIIASGFFIQFNLIILEKLICQTNITESDRYTSLVSARILPNSIR